MSGHNAYPQAIAAGQAEIRPEPEMPERTLLIGSAACRPMPVRLLLWGDVMPDSGIIETSGDRWD